MEQHRKQFKACHYHQWKVMGAHVVCAGWYRLSFISVCFFWLVASIIRSLNDASFDTLRVVEPRKRSKKVKGWTGDRCRSLQFAFWPVDGATHRNARLFLPFPQHEFLNYCHLIVYNFISPIKSEFIGQLKWGYWRYYWRRSKIRWWSVYDVVDVTRLNISNCFWFDSE